MILNAASLYISKNNKSTDLITIVVGVLERGVGEGCPQAPSLSLRRAASLSTKPLNKLTSMRGLVSYSIDRKFQVGVPIWFRRRQGTGANIDLQGGQNQTRRLESRISRFAHRDKCLLILRLQVDI